MRPLLDIKKSIRHQINSTLGSNVGELLDLREPPNPEMGDLALACFQIAPKTGQTPAEIAKLIASELHGLDQLERVYAAGPYVNIFLNRPKVFRALEASLKNENRPHWGTLNGKGRKALVEHTSINPNASPHIGRARNALIGDCLCKLLSYEGFEVESHYYVNNMGKQVALLALQCRELDSFPTFHELLDHYVTANKRAKEDPEFEQKGFDLLGQFEAGESKAVEEINRLVQTCIEGQTGILANIGIKYDQFDLESDFITSPDGEALMNVLRDKGVTFIDSESREVLDLEKIGVSEKSGGRYFVLRRANGSTLYGYRDIVYSLHKVSQAEDLNLIVLGEDHRLYYQQLSAILSEGGATPAEVVHYGFIRLKDGKLSTRTGKVVLLEDFLEEATSAALSRIVDSGRFQDVQTRVMVAESVAIASAKFGILKVSPSSGVIFDWDSALSFEGNSGPYLQYAFARVRSILQKVGAVRVEFHECVLNDKEWELLVELGTVADSIEMAVDRRDPSVIATKALSLARAFGSFYHACPVLGAEAESVRGVRTKLCQGTLFALEDLLNILGLPVLDNM